MIRLLKVSGESLSPKYQEGDFVVVSKIPFLFDAIKPGDTVVFKQPGYGTMIKQVDRVEPEKDAIYVIGTRPDSVDSRNFGAVGERNVLGTVIWHIKKP
jgi:signal peptidase I